METFANFYNYTTTELSGGLILFNLLFSFILQMVIVYVYKKTRHGLSYSQSFIFTLIIVGTLGTSVMMAVQNNVIGALAIFGAFTLIRFRSILKETSDLAYVFFALVIGISVGMGHYALSLITAGFLSIVIYAFHRFGFGSVSDNYDYLLLFTASKGFSNEILHERIEDEVNSRELLHVKHFEDGAEDYAYALRLKDHDDPTTIANIVRGLKHVSKVELLTGKNTSEF
jgi:uncharacterized membrane protein YhiD involved in acid resistance